MGCSPHTKIRTLGEMLGYLMIIKIEVKLNQMDFRSSHPQ